MLVSGQFALKRRFARENQKPAGRTIDGLTLQIGDTPADFSKMKVQIGDMYTDGCGKKQKNMDAVDNCLK